MLQPRLCDELAGSLRGLLKKNRDYLLKMSMESTGNSHEDTLTDLGSSINYLEGFNSQNMPKMRKPKGNILIILSVNEPLLLSIVPIFSALAAGNSLLVRPSSRNLQLFNSIWSEVISRLELNMKIISDPIDQIESSIRQVSAVYFFGSHQNAKDVYLMCAKNFVEFIPEIEAADTSVYGPDRNDIADTSIVTDIAASIDNAFSHEGKICQRITGVYVHNNMYSRYINLLRNHLYSLNFLKFTHDLEAGYTGVIEDIYSSTPDEIYSKGNQYVVVNPAGNSHYARGAYFDKTIWIKPYSRVDDLIETLESRPYRMGLNIMSEDELFVRELIDGTSFSRYTLGSGHCDLSADTGWGGSWPTGSSGYADWYTTFSNSYTIIKN